MEADIATKAVELGSNTDFSLLSLFIKADIIVGSIRIDLESFSNLNNPFEIKFD